jgi:hypothetical protein
MDGRLMARVDLKAQRTANRLLVAGSFLEAWADAERVAPALAHELRELAGWLRLDEVRVGRRGGFSGPLREALRAHRRG